MHLYITCLDNTKLTSWKYCPGNGISTGAYIIFYKGGPIYHVTHVLVPVDNSRAESEHNAACSTGMVLANFRMLIHKLLNKDPDRILEEAPLIILEIKSVVCMANNGKYTKYTRHIYRRVNFVRNGEK